MSATDLARLADLLDDENIFDLVAGAIADARDRAPRHKSDADSGDVLNHVIDVVRAEAAASAPVGAA